jgi:hypothetical protein
MLNPKEGGISQGSSLNIEAGEDAEILLFDLT